MAKIPYFRPRGSLHDLDAVVALDDARTHLLCVSDRTLYLLGNLASLDITMSARWQEERLNDGYIPVSKDSARYDLFLETVNNFQLEVLPVDCDIVTALAGIESAIRAIQLQQATSALVCCSYEFDPATYYDPDPEEGDPENKCALAYSYALAWAAGVVEVYHQWSAGAFPALGVLSAILDELGLPGQVLLEIVSIGAANALPVLESVFQGNVETLIPNVTCAVYEATSASQAKSNIEAEILALEGLDPLVAQFLNAPVAIATLNTVFDGTFPITDEAIPNCNECQDYGEEFLIVTSQASPYNLLVVGDFVSGLSDGAYGYQGDGFIYFTPTVDAVDVELTLETWENDFTGTGGILRLETADGGQNNFCIFDAPAFVAGVWNPITRTKTSSITLEAETQYRLYLEQPFGQVARWRKIILQSV